MNSTMPISVGASFLAGMGAVSISGFFLAAFSMGEVRGCISESTICIGAHADILEYREVADKIGGLILVACLEERGYSVRSSAAAALNPCARGAYHLTYGDGMTRTTMWLEGNKIVRIHRNWQNPIEL